MSLLALDNLLHRGVMQRRFHGDLRIRAVESLLFERIPVVRIPLEEPQYQIFHPCVRPPPKSPPSAPGRKTPPFHACIFTGTVATR